MSGTRIAQRYAKSLLSSALDNKCGDKVFADMKAFKTLVGESPEFNAVLRSPIIPPLKKASILDAAFKGKVEDISLKFYKVAIEKGREGYLPEMANAFIDQYNSYKELTKATLTTAVSPSKELLAKVEKILTSQAGLKEVELETIIDESIIGGFILKYGDNLYDDSISSRMRDLKSEFSKNTYVKKFRH